MTEPAGPDDPGRLVDHFFRLSYGRAVAALARRLGPEHLDLAEDAVQDAMAKAVRVWPLQGIPRDPGAWIWRVALNRATDLVRRDIRRDRLLPKLLAQSGSAGAAAAEVDPSVDPDRLPDEQLELMLLCCHPALGRREQVALTLKVVAGFGTAEVARAFLVPETTLAQRVVRAKRRLAEAGARFDAPVGADLEARLAAVLDVLYLVFNEGYSFGPGEATLKADVAAEAVRLCRALSRHPVGDRPPTHALLALLLFQTSRLAARVGPDGAAVPLDEQDRGRWDREAVGEAVRALGRAAAGEELTDLHLLAGIAACHADPAGTDWPRVLALYDDLVDRSPTPLVRVNRVIAVARVAGPEVALAELDAVVGDGAAGRVPAHVVAGVRADLLRLAGDARAAAVAYEAAAAAAVSEPERRFFLARVADPLG